MRVGEAGGAGEAGVCAGMRAAATKRQKSARAKRRIRFVEVIFIRNFLRCRNVGVSRLDRGYDVKRQPVHLSLEGAGVSRRRGSSRQLSAGLARRFVPSHPKRKMRV